MHLIFNYCIPAIHQWWVKFDNWVLLSSKLNEIPVKFEKNHLNEKVAWYSENSSVIFVGSKCKQKENLLT